MSGIETGEDGWRRYVHPRYQYQIDFPINSTIRESLGDSMKSRADYPNGGCVTLEYKFGRVQISAPDNNEPCHIMGLGTGYKKQSKEVFIGSMKLMADGFEYPGDELEMKNEYLNFTTPDGFLVTYSINPENAEDLLQYDTVWSDIQKMAESYRSLGVKSEVD